MTLIEPILRAFVAIAAIIVLVRLVGLRSFSKMSSIDFVTTVAIGSVLAGAISKSGIAVSLVSFVALFAIIWLASVARRHSLLFTRLVDNEPILLMEDGRMLADNLATANITHADVYAKLREANALDLSRVRAVVLESTGDVSVLHADPGAPLSAELLQGIRR